MGRDNIEISEETGVRYLHFGSPWIQGAMRIRRPYALELEYTRAMMACLLLRPEARKFLLIGLGAASLVRFIHRHLSDARLTVIEINPRVVDAAREFFALPHDPARIRVIIADGVEFVRQSNESFDVALVDGFDHLARAGRLDSLAFYRLCRARLSSRGLTAVNLFGRSRNFERSIVRIAQAFENRIAVLPPCAAGNVIALAANGGAVSPRGDMLAKRASALKQATGLDLAEAARALAQQINAANPL
jgi:spermidine synthase